jgi:class 3 adenylate cyclase/tetratricopeptide (TPR) repeat protein
VAVCQACEAFLPASARFCPQCGIAVSAQDSGRDSDPRVTGMGHERRHLTVLFCDLVGSTELSTTVDAEEFSDLLQAYHQRAVTIARRYAGDVEGYSGDGITFRFGWPEAHDDDAAQALRAALEIVTAVEELDEQGRLKVRAGVHSGLVIVGQMGGQGRRATMALGETMNLAARLQTAAAPGTVVASAATVALVDGLFFVEPLGALELKGIAEPVEAFRVIEPTDVRSRLEAAGGRLAPFIGRGRETGELVARCEGLTEGRGAAVLIRGEPGVGKSRLAHEMRHVAVEEQLSWIDCSCSPYTQMSVLWPVVQVIEQGIGVKREDDPVTRLERVRAGLEGAGVDVPDAEGLVATLLGIPGPPLPSLSPERRLERTIDVLVAWVLALSRQQSLVLLVDDVQWSDPTTLDLLDRLLERVADNPLFLLMTARTDFVDPWTASEIVTRIDLEPFTESDVRRLVDAVSGERSLPEAFVERIVHAAAGIPLFAEEMGRSLLESGMLVADGGRWEVSSPHAEVEIPQTLQGSLLARLDRLGPAKGVAQVAAVIGRDFRLDLLGEVSGIEPELLSELTGRLVESAIVVEEDGPERSFYFRHILIQEVAYESLLRRTRRTLHERVAQLLRSRLQTGATVAPEVIARHFEAAGAGRDAIEHYQLAASRAAEGSGHREAVFFLRRGIDLIGNEPEGVASRELEIEMQLSLGSAIMATKSYADPEIQIAYERARELCEHLGNDERVGLALAGLSIYYINRGETGLGATLAERVLEIASAHGDDTLELLGSVQLALALHYQGQADGNLEHSLRAVEIYDPSRHAVIAQRFGTDHGVAAHCFAAWGFLTRGYLDRGLRHMDDAVDLAEGLAHPFNLAYALTFRATAHWERGESSATYRDARRARELAEELGFDWWAVIGGLWEMAELVVAEGDLSALPRLLELATAASEFGNRGGSTTVMALVANAFRAAGDLETASSFVDLALNESIETNQLWWDSDLHRIRAELLAARSATAGGSAERDALSRDAEDEWRKALHHAEQLGYPVHGVRAAKSYATHLHGLGRSGEALQLLREHYRRCPEGFSAPVLVEAKATLDDLERAVGDRP